MTVRIRSLLAALALGLAISGTAIAADRPPDDERLAPAVAQTKRIAREVELRHRLPGAAPLGVSARSPSTVARATRSSLAGKPWSSLAERSPRRSSISSSSRSRSARRGCFSSSSSAGSTAEGTDATAVDRLTRDRLYATAGLIAFSDTEDSLALVKLRSRR